MYNGTIIDVDLHHGWRDGGELSEYLPAEWRDVFFRPKSAVSIEAPVALFHHTTGNNKRIDADPAEGGPPGSSYDKLCEQWLDPVRVERAILSFDVGMQSGVPNPRGASALCRAANDWSIDRWIDAHHDDRLYAAALVPTQIPEDGVAEIERMAENPRVVEALLVANGLGKPFGHPSYEPIFAAAEAAELPLAIHIGGDQYWGTTHFVAGGLPLTRLEFHSLSAQSTITHIVSFIANGVFERFPKLKLVMIEGGMSWLPWLMWSLDRDFDLLRSENSSLKRLPNEVLREHVRVSTQPMDLTPGRGQLAEALETADGMEDMLCFASDYPHFDNDNPGFVARRIPESWWPKVFHDNTLKVMRWPKESAVVAGVTGNAG